MEKAVKQIFCVLAHSAPSVPASFCVTCLKPVSLLHQTSSQRSDSCAWRKSFRQLKVKLLLCHLDPTRGSLLGMLARTPDIRERIAQGGVVGYLTIAVGIVGLLVTLYRTLYLLLLRASVLRQIAASDKPSEKNPLGRIMLSVQAVSMRMMKKLFSTNWMKRS
jgi:hypothetical protein